MEFSSEFFQNIDFKTEQTDQYINNAKKDFITAKESKNADVIMHFCYMAIVKLGIALIAMKGYKVRSIPGHHVQILEKLGEITGMKKEVNYLQHIRRKRNTDLYEGGISLTQKESEELLKITEEIFRKYNKPKGFSLVELIVALTISAIIMIGMSAFFSSTFQNIFTAQERSADAQEQFTMNEVIRGKLLNIDTMIEPVAPNNSDSLVFTNDTSGGRMPFTYIGTEDISGDDYAVIKDFFVFNGLYGSTPSVDAPGVSNPAGLTSLNGNYYVISPTEDIIYECTGVGDLSSRSCSDFGIGVLDSPIDVTTDGTDLYVTDSGNNRVIKVDGATSAVTEIADGFNFPTGIVYYNDSDDGLLFVSDTYNNLIKKIDLAGNTVTTVVGLGSNEDCDNTAEFCKLNFPTGLHVQGNELYIADTGNQRILKVSDPGSLSTATIPFLPSDLNLNVGLVKVTFENMTDLGTDLEATNQSSGLHVGAYENSGNEFLYKFYTQLTNDAEQICTMWIPPCVSWIDYDFMEVNDGYLLNGDTVEVETSASTFNVFSDYVVVAPFSHTIAPESDSHSAGSYVVLTNNKYADEKTFDLDLTGATGINDYNVVKIEIFEANTDNDPPYNTPSSEPEQKMVLRNGDGILGTAEDIIQVESTGLDYPTGLGWSSSLEVSNTPVYDEDAFTSFGYTSDFILNTPLNFTYNPVGILDLIVDAVVGEDNKQYTLSTSID